jgi:hypothetical protein
MNQFQKWAHDYARAFGFIVTTRGNWVELHRNGETIECMSVQGVQEACEKSSKQEPRT